MLKWQIESLQEALADRSNFYPGKCSSVYAASLRVALCVSPGRLPGLEKTFLEMFSLNAPGFLLCSNFQISHSFICEILLSLLTILNVFSWIYPTCSYTESLATEVNRDSFWSSRWVNIERLERHLFRVSYALRIKSCIIEKLLWRLRTKR